MNASELRLGNWVETYMIFDNGMGEISDPTIRQLQVTIEDLRIISGAKGLATYRPIPLSPEVLKACGFVNDYGEKWSNGMVELLSRQPHFKSGYLLLNGEERTHWAVVYNHLHQLQNLFFALTSKELNYQP